MCRRCSKAHAAMLAVIVISFANSMFIHADEIVDRPSCKLSRHLTNSGFHRDLVTQVELKTGRSINHAHCRVLLIEDIPSGLYVDKYQIAAQVAFGGPLIYSADEINMESPQHLSPNHEVYVWDNMTIKGDTVATLVTMPVHARYHAPAEERDSATVHIDPPTVFAQCNGATSALQSLPGEDVFSACDNSNVEQLCDWRQLQCEHADGGGPLTLEVPVGRTQHAPLVMAGTLLVTLASAAMLIVVLFRTDPCPKGKGTSSDQCQPQKRATQKKSQRRKDM